jgi:membrane associated rhomboid family serine protease
MQELRPTESADVEPEVPPGPPRPVYTYVLIGSIIAVFIAQILFGDALGTLSPTVLAGDERSAIAAGFVKQYFTRYHEYWRILTGAAVHGSLLHVAMNSYAFLMFGRLVEMLSNRAHLALVFLLSCIGGGLLSLYFLPGIPSVGASGGIVGLLGYVTVYAFRRRRFIAPEFRRSLLINIGFLFVFGLVLFNVVDNYGHLGGLITGVAYGAVQIPSNEYVDPRQARPITRAAGALAVGIFVAACILSIILIFDFRNARLPESLDAPSSSSSAR